MNNRLTAPENSDLRRLEGVIEKGIKTFIEVGLALKEIRDKKLYREKWKTFEAYCEGKYDFTRQRAYQLIEAAGVVDKVKKMSTKVNKIEIKNESQARAILEVPDEELDEVLEEMVEHQKETGDPITGSSIKKAAQKVASKKSAIPAYDDSGYEEVEDEPPPIKEQISKLRSVAIQHYQSAMRAVDDMNSLQRDKKHLDIVAAANVTIQDAVRGGWK